MRLLRLDRVHRLFDQIGRPDNALKIVHVAGSKGKGSTCGYAASLLAAGGARVGLYTSPHVTGYRERFTVLEPGQAVGEPRTTPYPDYEATLAAAGEQVWGVVRSMVDDDEPEEAIPTTFELLTALACLFFVRMECEWVVLETGMGGRLDATNVCSPRITVLTRIELEHTEYLGTTYAAIAGEKAGIIKTNVPAILAPQRPEAGEVFRRIAAERGAPVIEVTPLAAGRAPGTTVCPGDVEVRPLMAGGVQRTNIAAAIAAVDRLTESGELAPMSPDVIARAIARTRLPGRGEIIGTIMFDGAHTAESVAHVVETVATLLGHQPAEPPNVAAPSRIPVIFAAVSGKDVAGMARSLAPIASTVIVARPGTFRPGDPAAVAAAVAEAGLHAELHLEAADALARARELAPTEGVRAGAPTILVTGSFYLVAEIRALVVP